MYIPKCSQRTGSASHQAIPNKAARKWAASLFSPWKARGALYFKRYTLVQIHRTIMKPWESCYLPNILHRVRPKQFPSLSGLRSVFQTFREPNSVSGYRRLTWTSSGGGLVAKSCLTLATLWTVACQAPLSMGFSRQEYWSGCNFLLQGIFPTQGWTSSSLHI